MTTSGHGQNSHNNQYLSQSGSYNIRYLLYLELVWPKLNPNRNGVVELWTILGLSGGRKRRQNAVPQMRPDEEEEETAELSFYETTTYQGDSLSEIVTFKNKTFYLSTIC